MPCTFTAIVCHPARVTDLTEEPKEKKKREDFFCNEDNKIYLLFKASNKDRGKKRNIKGYDKICAFHAKTSEWNKIIIISKNRR